MLKYQNENIGESFSFKCRFHDKYTVPPHIHEYSEIVYVCSGALTAYVNGERISVPAGHGVFIFPNDIHEYTAETPCNMWCAVFSNDFVHSFYRLYPDKTPVNCVIDLSEIESTVLALMNSSEDAVVLRSGLLHIIYSELIKKSEFKDRDRSNNSLYYSAINYIAENFRNDFTLTDMAKDLGYHEKYLSSTLHSLTKMNFRSFLSTYRINHAKSLLKSSGETIAQIAMESGFSSLNTFNRVFKSITGKTPSDYKRDK
ncbi:MAG: helix-turn-helix transcriptional regulator [Clostridia bacterium]|nr:helix-turn-helix transcriptional regulator [Clostridia bacterium]